MDEYSDNLNKQVWSVVEHDGNEDLKELLFEAMELYINQRAGRVLVKKRDQNELPLFTEDVNAHEQ